MQPTTACNLNCTYCYLPERKKSNRMGIEVARAVAENLRERQRSVTLVWHGGEPLAIGIDRFRELLEPFSTLRRERLVRHNLQTNATLISEEWCALFKEQGVVIGISIDGDEDQNSARASWSGSQSFQSAFRGINVLRNAEIPFGVIAVVNSHNISKPQRLYEFAISLGCETLNVNVEEKEGQNLERDTLSDQAVRVFWQGLFNAWRRNPAIRVRELQNALSWLSAKAKNSEVPPLSREKEFWPTVATNGDVVVLSPELISVPASERSRFVVGNVLKTSLQDIVELSKTYWYIQEFFSGVSNCAATCPYYEYCGGGEASNKYFELNDITGTETAHCRHTKKLVVDAILDVI